MEKRDAFVLLLVLGGAGYAAFTHWDQIAAKLGFDDLSPGRRKEIELAKKSSDFEGGVTNWQYIESRHKRGEIQVTPEPWSAEPIGGQEYSVVVRWIDDGDRIVLGFRVDVAKRTVVYEGALGTSAAPR